MSLNNIMKEQNGEAILLPENEDKLVEALFELRAEIDAKILRLIPTVETELEQRLRKN